MFAQIAIPTPFKKLFDYLIPNNLQAHEVQPGMRVIVPFGRKQLVGMILNVGSSSSVAPEKLKPITTILDEKPLFTEANLQLLRWASEYYHYPLSEVIFTFLPKLLREGKSANIQINSKPELNSINPSSILLNLEQQAAIDAINTASGFKPFLLEGITGSGKTEVYLQAIAKTIDANKQALVLIPEIGLTPQTIARFNDRFAQKVVSFHSKLTDRERIQSWWATKHHSASVMIGTRSAVLTPFANLGLIIIDEEHDSSFKQQSGLRYMTRSLALMRSKIENIPIVLGSATPAIETIYNVKRGLFHHLKLTKRAGGAVQPQFRLLDLRGKKITHGISTQLITEIKRHLEMEGQVLLFLNQRGYSPVLLCHDCGWMSMCDHCDAKLTLHLKPTYLICHHCNSIKALPVNCPQCHSERLVKLGLGTERLEEALNELFPEVKVIRIDRDTTKRKHAIEQILADVHAQQYRILLGTQMLAKGHHFPKVTMVAIINVDNGLLSTDFRAVESTAQLIMQVAGRAGRAEKAGEVYIQTYNPENSLLQSLIKHGYQRFAEETLKQRRETNLPPFSHFVSLKAVGKNQAQVLELLNICKDLGTGLNRSEIKLLGPVPAPIQRKADFYHAQLLINSQQRPTMHDFLNRLIPQIEQLSLAKKVHWVVDVDPMD